MVSPPAAETEKTLCISVFKIENGRPFEIASHLVARFGGGRPKLNVAMALSLRLPSECIPVSVYRLVCCRPAEVRFSSLHAVTVGDSKLTVGLRSCC